MDEDCENLNDIGGQHFNGTDAPCRNVACPFILTLSITVVTILLREGENEGKLRRIFLVRPSRNY